MTVAQRGAARRELGNEALYARVCRALEIMEHELDRLCRQAPEAAMRRDLLRVVFAGGKRLRPTLAFLCAGAGTPAGPALDPGPLMCMLELMHTASLIHDDVVDGAGERRGVETIHKTSGVEMAVQSGDFLLAQAMQMLSFYRGTGINETLEAVSGEMCRGEFQQQRTRFSLTAQTRALYESQIRRKTSSLLAASCYTGALSGGLSRQDARRLERYGDRLGMAFQIQDDILDFTAPPGFGKQAGQDLRSGVFTLPVLLLKPQIPADLWALMEKRDKTGREVEEILCYVKASGALEEARREAEDLGEQAVQALDGLRGTPERTALGLLARRLTHRDDE